MRARDRMLQLTARIASSLLWWASSYHLRTDPACTEYVPPRAGSRLERTSRGYSCNRCMRMRAIGYIQTSPDSGPCICARPLPVGESPRPCPEHGWLGQGFAPSPDSDREADRG